MGDRRDGRGTVLLDDLPAASRGGGGFGQLRRGALDLGHDDPEPEAVAEAAEGDEGVEMTRRLAQGDSPDNRSGRWSRWQKKTWALFEDPYSSKYARVSSLRNAIRLCVFGKSYGLLDFQREKCTKPL